MNTSRLLSSLTACTLIAWALSSVAQAVPAKLSASEPGSRINIRSAPSKLAPSPHYGLNGDDVEVLRQVRGQDGEIWFHVQFKVSGAKGWVRQDLIKISPSAAATPSADNDESGRARSIRVVSAQGPSVQATLIYGESGGPDGTGREWTDLQLTINRLGQRFQVPPPERLDESQQISSLEKPKLHLVDFEGDRDPEVVLTLFTGGAHCCMYSLIYSFAPQANQYLVTKANWGNLGFDPQALKDLNADGNLELMTLDDRFAYAFSSYAASYRPISIKRFRQGGFIDVTKEFPSYVRQSASKAWQAYLAAKASRDSTAPPGEFTRPPLAAYLASKLLIGEGADGWQRVKAAYQLPDRLAFFQQLQRFLINNQFDR